VTDERRELALASLELVNQDVAECSTRVDEIRHKLARTPRWHLRRRSQLRHDLAAECSLWLILVQVQDRAYDKFCDLPLTEG
jgi:hypothetical protein